MMKYFALLPLFAMAMSGTAQASDADVQKYCEDASVVMQVAEAEKAAYIASCVEARKAELDEE